MGGPEIGTFIVSKLWMLIYFSNFFLKSVSDALLSPLLDPLEGQIMLSCEKLGLEGRSRLPALKGGRGAC
jgi:hypothetical protein